MNATLHAVVNPADAAPADPCDILAGLSDPAAAAVKLLATARGHSAAEALRARIARLEARARDAASSYAINQRGARAALALIAAWVRERHAAEDRLASLLAILEPEASPETVDRAPVAEEARRILAEIGGGRAVAELAELRRQVEREAAAILAEARRKLHTAFATAPAGSYSTQAGQWEGDAAVSMLEGVARGYIEARDLVALLESDRSSATRLTAAAVTAAIKSAGGVEAVAAGLKAVEQADGSFLTRDPESGTLSRLEGEAADLAAQRGRVEAGELADDLDAKIAAAKGAAERLRAEIAGRRAAALRSLVESALAGEEPGRAELERRVRARPAAFKAGLAGALAAAAFDAQAASAAVEFVVAGEAK